jgi:hypothetical protein
MEIITKYNLEQEVFYLTADGIRSGIIKEIKCNVSISEIKYLAADGHELYPDENGEIQGHRLKDLIHPPKKLIFDRRDISYKVQPSDKNTAELELDENKLYSTKEELIKAL